MPHLPFTAAACHIYQAQHLHATSARHSTCMPNLPGTANLHATSATGHSTPECYICQAQQTSMPHLSQDTTHLHATSARHRKKSIPHLPQDTTHLYATSATHSKPPCHICQAQKTSMPHLPCMAHLPATSARHSKPPCHICLAWHTSMPHLPGTANLPATSAWNGTPPGNICKNLKISVISLKHF